MDTSKIPYTITKLIVPEREELVKILQDGLEQNFADVTVEWVDCPDLTLEPFKLVVSGLCGNEALLDIGDFKDPYGQKEKVYTFEKILPSIGRHQCGTFITGGGFHPLQDGGLSRHIMNTFFDPVTSEGTQRVWSRSKSFNPKITISGVSSELGPTNITCGNFFVSDGKSGPVLKVYAKKRIGSRSFIDAMQESLHRKYSYQGYTLLPVGLGGTFVMRYSNMVLNHLSYDWPFSTTDLESGSNHYEIPTPAVALGAFTNTDLIIDIDALSFKTTKIQLTTNHFHVRSQSKIGYFYTDVEPDDVEYLGYFSPAKYLYRFDPKNM